MHVIKPLSNFQMFYNVTQPGETFIGVEGLEDFFQKLRMDAKLPTNFEIAWQGYRFAHETRKKIVAGNATIFPVRSAI